MSGKNIYDSIKVRDVMRTRFDTIDGTATVAEALEEMEHHDTKALIVKKRDDEDEHGLLLVADIARNVLGKGRAPERINVYEVMVKPVLCISPNMNIRYCARLLDQFDLSRAPVVEDGEIVGIVSLTELVIRGLVGKH